MRVAAQLLAALDEGLGPRVAVGPTAGGMHLILRLPPDLRDETVLARLRAQGLAGNALSALSLEARMAPALLLGFANLSVEHAAEAVAHLQAALDMPARRDR